MQWKLLVSLATLFGLSAGLVGVAGWTAEVGPSLYFVGLIVCLFVFTRKLERRHTLHGLLLGLLIGAVEALVGQLFVDTYVTNNPDLAEAYMWSFGLFFVFVGLVRGVSYGAVLALVGWLTGRIAGMRSTGKLHYQAEDSSFRSSISRSS